MRSVNKVILIGNLTRDPELKSTTSGQTICTFGVATNREWINKSGEKQSLTEFHELAAWGRLGEICHEFLKKGTLVYIEGYLKTRSWEGEDGTKRFRTEIVVDDMTKLEKHNSSREHTPTTENNNAGDSALSAFADDDLPASDTPSYAA